MSPRSHKLHDITVTEVHETDKAIKLTDGVIEFWVPKSILGDNALLQLDPNKDGSFTLTGPEWWFLDRELI